MMPHSRAGDEDGSERERLVVPLVEEEARLERRTVSAGRVRIQVTADVLEEVATATLDGEEVEVVRVPVDRVVTDIPKTRMENGVTIVPILEEVLVVSKQLVLREELHIHRRTKSETVEVPVSLRKQRAIVQHIDGRDAQTRSDTDGG
jgi:stress response protein YsnF